MYEREIVCTMYVHYVHDIRTIKSKENFTFIKSIYTHIRENKKKSYIF